MVVIYTLIILSLLPYLFLIIIPQSLTGISLLANVFGLLAFQLIVWQILLGIKQVSLYFTPDRAKIITLHKILGIYSMIFIFLHPIVEMFVYNENLFYFLKLDFSNSFDTYLTFGRISIFILLITWLTSTFARKFMSYINWKYIHLLSYPMALLIYLHSVNIGTFLTTSTELWYYFLFWMILESLAILVNIYSVFKPYFFQYQLVDKQEMQNGISIYKLKPMYRKIGTPICGQYVYIKTKIFSDAHPFSIVSCDVEDGNINLGIKSVGPFTEKLEILEIGAKFFVEGPFGAFTKEGHNGNPKVIIAGGIGIAPFLSLVLRYGNSKTYLVNSNQYRKNILFYEIFHTILGNRFINILTKEMPIENDEMIYSRLNSNIIIQKIPQDIIQAANWFICGSEKLTKHTIKELKKLNIKENRIFTEEFSM